MRIRDFLQIDGPWRFSPDPHGEGESLGFWQPVYCTRLWREVTVPSCFEAGCPNIDFYEGICWYRRSFCLPSAWRGRRVVLRFEAVNYRARVWLNGKFLGEHRDGFLPFEYEIQRKARWDGDNVLAVSVDNTHHEGDVPGMHVGWRGCGGILREVRLYVTDLLHIEKARAIAVPGTQGGEIVLRVRVRNARSVAVNGSLKVTIHDVDGTARMQLSSRPVRLEPNVAASVTVKGTLVDARPWSPSSPMLYRARTQLKIDDRIVDELDTTFGFRRIEATPDGLLLNGNRIFLTGFNRHEDSPRTAMAVDLETTRRDLEDMKEAGASFVRLCHYPHPRLNSTCAMRSGCWRFARYPSISGTMSTKVGVPIRPASRRQPGS